MIEPGPSGLDHLSYAKCEDIKAVSDRRLVDREDPSGHMLEILTYDLGS